MLYFFFILLFAALVFLVVWLFTRAKEGPDVTEPGEDPGEPGEGPPARP